MTRVLPLAPLAFLAAAFVSSPGTAQNVSLYGITGSGAVISIDPTTGAGTLVRTLPPPYDYGVDSLVYLDGFFYASYGDFAGGGRVVRFGLLSGELDLGSSGAHSIEDMSRAADGTIYVSYNDTNPLPPFPANKIGILSVDPSVPSCAVIPVCEPGSPFLDMDAVGFDALGRLWLANLQSPSHWGRLSLPDCQVSGATAIASRLLALAPRGADTGGAQSFFASRMQPGAPDFGRCDLITIDESGTESLVGAFGFNDLNGLVALTENFASLCDPGVAGVVPCPCGNAPSGSGRGCDNSAGTGGAALAAAGYAYLGSDSLVFTTSGERPTSLSIVLQGSAAIPGGTVYGQGVRCVGGTLKRLYTKSAVGGSIVAPDFGAGDPAVHVRSASLGDPIAPGSSRWTMVYYRDPIVLGGCPAASTFNATQTLSVAWWP